MQTTIAPGGTGLASGERVTVVLDAPVDLPRTIGSLRRGHRDPTYTPTTDGAIWRTTLMPAGAATLRLQQTAPDTVVANAWGPGATEALASAPGMVGAHDDGAAFDPPPGVVRDAHRRTARIRIPRTVRVRESLLPAILEQKVITRTAHDAWRALRRLHGAPAPGPAPVGMRVPPSAEVWARVPTWDFHRAGVDPRRARTVVEAARLAHAVEGCVRLDRDSASARLCHVRGVGPWTAAETAQRALGDADAVSVGDFHLPNQVGWALAGRRTDDAGMLELLEPYRGHRYRVIRALMLCGLTRYERHGPRMSIEEHRRR